MHDAAVFAPLLTFALLLSGCSHKAGWLHGKWTFDAEYTRQKLEQTAKTEPSGVTEGLLGALKDLASGVVGSRLTGLLEGANLLVTDKEIILTTKDGSGKAFTYEVVEKPNADTITVKLSDGEVSTYHREGERMWTASSGTLHMRAYFVRAK